MVSRLIGNIFNKTVDNINGGFISIYNCKLKNYQNL